MLLLTGAFAYMFREQPAAETSPASATASSSPGDKGSKSKKVLTRQSRAADTARSASCSSTRNIDTAHEVLKRLFKKNRFDMELRQLNRPNEDKPMGKIVYVLTMWASVSTDRLSEEILASDRDNIDSVEWEQKDSQTYIYK